MIFVVDDEYSPAALRLIHSGWFFGYDDIFWGMTHQANGKHRSHAQLAFDLDSAPVAFGNMVDEALDCSSICSCPFFESAGTNPNCTMLELYKFNTQNP